MAEPDKGAGCEEEEAEAAAAGTGCGGATELLFEQSSGPGITGGVWRGDALGSCIAAIGCSGGSRKILSLSSAARSK